MLDNPRSIGQALHGEKFGELWRYRVGDWRIICQIQDAKLVVVALPVGHRREVYECKRALVVMHEGIAAQ